MRPCPGSQRTGRLTQDVTQGYGPEMYIAKHAQRGRYTIQAHYFASDRKRMSARSKVYATIIEGYGTAHEKVRREVVTLTTGKDIHEIATVTTR